MDNEDESPAYLKFFNDGPHNYLLHSGEDGLSDAFPVEPIFTEITSDWPTEGFPILLSGSLIAEDNNDSGSPSNNAQISSDENVINEDSNGDNTVTVFSNIDQNELILSDDGLLRVQDSNGGHLINGDTISITYAQDSDVMQPEDHVEVIQLSNIDGTVTTIDKKMLNIVNGGPKTNMKRFYSQIQAFKCNFCAFICEHLEEITLHINLKHMPQNIQASSNGNFNDSNLVGTKMRSILNLNTEQKKYVVFLCSECGNSYSKKDDLKEHMQTDHNLICVPDNLGSNGERDAKSAENERKVTHRIMSTTLLKKQQNAMKKVKCSIKGCPLKFANDESRNKHEECHVDQNKKQFMCLVCKQKFSIWRICSMHMWKNHSIDLDILNCPMCNQFKSFSPARMISHMATHSEERPFVCATCGRAFKQVTQLRVHEVTHKPIEEQPSSFTMKQCEFCQQFFSNTKCLKKHIKFVHDKFKPFICNICGHQTARKEMLQLHYRQHTGDKPYHCPYCVYKTGDRNCLRKHKMRHFGAAKYSCPHCEYQSIQTSAYKVHLAKKHPGKEGSHSCSLCSYSTVNIRTYLAHVKCHELENKKKKSNEGNNEKQLSLNGESISKSGENKNVLAIIEDDETQNCFLNNEHSEDAVDTGGITIPAELD